MAAPAPAPGLRHEFVEANGLRFHVAACGDGERLALCLHGFPECWYSWRYQLPLLSRLGYRVWAPDLRGYGETDRPRRVADYAIETLMNDVAGLIDASGARSTLLVAHDWGAIIAWYFAIRRVRPLERLVVMNLPHPGAAGPAFRTWRQRRRSWYALFFQLPWLPEQLIGALRFRAIGEMIRRSCANPDRFPEEVLSVYRESAARPGAMKAMLDYYRAFVRGGGLVRQRRLGFPAIDTPTLLLWGEDDVAFGKETTFGTEVYVRDLTLRYLPGVSHWVQQDAPDIVNAMLEAWLGDRPVPESPLRER
ncbi:MAG: alpha/beta hydrolase [Myxococcales bacterium]|nr:alpha/beta hydrolase [Myxococcales bacterium]